jgi:hypothetical protein
VGEVLDEEEYLRRKQYYHLVGQRHYYFMNIGNGEVCSCVCTHFAPDCVVFYFLVALHHLTCAVNLLAAWLIQGGNVHCEVRGEGSGRGIASEECSITTWPAALILHEHQQLGGARSICSLSSVFCWSM